MPLDPMTIQAPSREPADTKIVFELEDVAISYGANVAISGVNLQVPENQITALIGPSGCGKSTLARMVALIEKPTAGELRLSGIDAVNAPDEARKQLRQSVQMVFQNPYGSLNPRKKIGNILEAPLAINTTMSAAQRSEQGRAMMARVGNPGCWWPTNRFRHSTYRFRLKCSIFCSTCRRRWGWHICSSRTTSGWCDTLRMMCW
jgi:ABC-type glutathione transport system ATPase component